MSAFKAETAVCIDVREWSALQLFTFIDMVGGKRSFAAGPLWQAVFKESSHFFMSLKLQNVIKSSMKLTLADLIAKMVEGLDRRDIRFVYQMARYRMGLHNFVQLRLF